MPDTARRILKTDQLNRNLLIGFSVSLVLLIVSAIASIISIQRLRESTQWVNQSYEVNSTLQELQKLSFNAESAQRGYLLTRQDKYLYLMNEASENTETSFAGLQALVADNPEQLLRTEKIKEILNNRLIILKDVAETLTASGAVDMERLERGARIMKDLKDAMQSMWGAEQALLARRTTTVNKFATYTPIFILLAAGLALITTVVFYFRVRNELDRSAMLQQELIEKDQMIASRLALIQQVSADISSGQYDIRVPEVEGDGAIGSFSRSLNKMAQSLETSFQKLNDREWLQTGLANLNKEMISEKSLITLTEDVLSFIARYSSGMAGTIYSRHQDGNLQWLAGYGLALKDINNDLQHQEGLVGLAVRNRDITLVEHQGGQRLDLVALGGVIKPSHFLAIPLWYEGKIIAVAELAFSKAPTLRVMEFLREAARLAGIGLQTAINQNRLQELLEETQSQSEELRTQHHELENINAELEAQSQKLQASEEELRVQQEELRQANSELEERSHLLEERNEMIAERNIEIQKRAEELALTTRYKSEFLANMSHELRTPLNSILLLSRLLSDNVEANMSAEQVEYAEVIRSSGNGLLSLIDEILDLSKIEAGKMDVEPEIVPVQTVLDNMRSLFQPIANDRAVTLNILLDEDAAEEIETDKMRLEQILKNLLSNAFKFTKEGSVSMHIRSSMKGQGLEFLVVDTGIGIATEKQKLIFEAFQQADGSTRRKFGGTGLGLSISRELARLLGGALSLESEVGKGSSFRLSLPNRYIALPSHPELAQPSERNGKEDIMSPVAELSIPKITRSFLSDTIPPAIPDDRAFIEAGSKVMLIVEDDTAFAKSLLDFTRKRGYLGIVVVRGDEALPIALKYLPAAILLDIRLPVMSGWEVMEELKNHKSTKHIPVHIMSSEDARRESLQRGAVDFINKPVALEQMGDIFGKLEHVLNKNAKQVLIVEDNPKHARALANFFEGFDIKSQIASSVAESVALLSNKEVDCVILDMGIPDKKAYETLEIVKKNPGLENLPIIIFTGKSLSRAEEVRIKQYADSIVVKTAQSYRRMLDEVNLFLHLMEKQEQPERDKMRHKKTADLRDILKDKKILIADDDVRNIFSLSKSLEQHGVKVISATDGKEALKKLEENPDTSLVLMDMMMPEMDGYESTSRIRRNPATKKLPVIAVTAKTMMGDREKCIQAGASDYISKPVDVDQLLSLLRVWLYENYN